MANPTTFICPGCAKRYAWRPQMAGKKAKCTCGRMIDIPKLQAEEPEEHDSGLYSVVEDEKPSVAPVTKNIARCPSCGSMLPAATTLCIHCGFDSVTGKKIVAPTARNAHAERMVEYDKSEQKNNKTKVLMLLGLAIFLIAGAVIVFLLMKHQAATAPPALGDDATVAKMMDEHGHTELREWVKAGGRHMVLGMTDSQARGLADQWYAMGAKKVIAFGEVVTISLAIELPDDPAKRKEFFASVAPRYPWPNTPLPRDVGQKWLLLHMHP